MPLAVLQLQSHLLSIPPLPFTHTDTNKHKHAAVHKPGLIVKTLSSLGLSAVGVLFAGVVYSRPSIQLGALHAVCPYRIRGDELTASGGLDTGIDNLFNALAIPPHCLLPDRPSKVLWQSSVAKAQSHSNGRQLLRHIETSQTDRHRDSSS